MNACADWTELGLNREVVGWLVAGNASHVWVSVSGSWRDVDKYTTTQHVQIPVVFVSRSVTSPVIRVPCRSFWIGWIPPTGLAFVPPVLDSQIWATPNEGTNTTNIFRFSLQLTSLSGFRACHPYIKHTRKLTIAMTG